MKPISARLRHSLYQVIYQSNTPAGKGFDIALIIAILASVLTVMMQSVAEFNQRYEVLLFNLDWAFTILFTIEYGLRIYCIHKPAKYIFSFYGLIDFLSISPSYISLVIPGTQYLQVIRILRVLRIFRVLKLVRFINQSNILLNALKASRAKIAIFFIYYLYLDRCVRLDHVLD